MTYLCVPIFVHDLEKARQKMARAVESGADMVELRVDSASFLDACDLVKNKLVPVIVTSRPTWEGGFSDEDDTQRMLTLVFLAHQDANFVDVELKSFAKFPEMGTWIVVEGITNPKFILSSHDFQGRPDRLNNLIAELYASPADIAKIVWTARTIRDNLEAFEILLHRQKPTIALCMGEAGLLSRVLAKKFGAFLTFASLTDESATAPGQVTIGDMKKQYRWDAIDADTKVYGVVGSPIAHTMSPAIHNAAFEAVGHPGVYLPMLVNTGYESFKAFMESFLAMEELHLSGLSVTIPHKENALRYLKEKNADVEELAERIGAANTILIDRSAGSVKLIGRNTDYAAILGSITAKLNISRQDLANYRVAVIGAGGTGRTAVAALAHFGATVVIYNRTRERADALAAEFSGRTGKVVAAPMEKLCDSCCQIYINTTSVGMHPRVDESPFGERLPAVTSDTLVFDSIYNPMRTKLLKQADAAGAKTIGGVEMFLRQAVGQFELWTGKSAPTELMRQTIESRLA